MLWDLALRNLWQHRVRSILTILALAVAMAPVMALSSGGSSSAMDSRLGALGGKLFIQSDMGGNPVNFPLMTSVIPPEVAETLLTLPHVERAVSSRLLFVPLARPPSLGEPPAYLAVGLEPGHETAFLGQVQVTGGDRRLKESGQVLLGARAARHYAPEGQDILYPGQSIEIAGREFSVAGILEPDQDLVDGAVLMPLGTAQDLFVRPEGITAIVLTATGIEAIGQLKEEIQSEFPDLDVIDQEEYFGEATAIMESGINFFNVLENTFILIVIVIITVVMSIGVEEIKHEIGTLRALGAGVRAIFSLVAGQAVLLSMLGMAAAWPVWALMYMLFLGQFEAANITITSQDLLPNWLEILPLSVLVGILASLWPAWQASRVEPVAAMTRE